MIPICIRVARAMDNVTIIVDHFNIGMLRP
jgi:hypothetical protein